MGPLFTGSVTINSTTSTITRSDGGSFITDGFAVGQTLVVKGAGALNDNTAATAYVISAVTATTITLARTLTTVPPLREQRHLHGLAEQRPADPHRSHRRRRPRRRHEHDHAQRRQLPRPTASSSARPSPSPGPARTTTWRGVRPTSSPRSPPRPSPSRSVLDGRARMPTRTVSGVLPSPMLTSGFSPPPRPTSAPATATTRCSTTSTPRSRSTAAPASTSSSSSAPSSPTTSSSPPTAIYGAGIQVTFRNIQVVEVDALQGDDTIDVLSTAPGVATRVLGGLGSDVINVAGDVVGDVVSRDPNGTSSTINHLVISSTTRLQQHRRRRPQRLGRPRRRRASS